MKRFVYRNPLLKKIVATIIIVFVFLTGRYIPLPLVEVKHIYTPFLDLTNLSGGSLSHINIFSLGFGPWMYSTILMTLFTVRKTKSVSPRMMEFRKNVLMLLIALIQAFGMAISLTYQAKAGTMLGAILAASLVLIAGSFGVSWLASMNASYGMGGSQLLILVNIAVGQFGLFPKIIHHLNGPFAPFVWFWLFWVLLTIYIIVLLEKAEYRVPVRRIAIKNDLADEAYMPVKLNLAGGMPFMYAISLMTFPQYILMLFSYVFPSYTPMLMGLNRFFNLRTLEGILVYLLILYILSLSFAHVTLNPGSKAEDMRKQGEYIPPLRPGYETKQYLTNLVNCLGHFNGLFLIVMSGVPMFLGYFYKELQDIAMIPGILMMTAGMILGLILEVRIMRLKKRYTTLFE